MKPGTGWRVRRREGRRNRVLIIVENSGVPHDHRVWKEATSLVAAGYNVAVIAPLRPGQPNREILDGVEVHRYPPTRERDSKFGFVIEFASAWLHIAWRTTLIFMRDGFAAIQSCNPPDIFFTVAAPFKLAGCPFVFDQHDLSPELFTARYGTRGASIRRVLVALERATYATADHVIAMNEPQAAIALSRGKLRAGDISIVRNGPRLPSSIPSEPTDLRRGRKYLGCWVGAMGAVDDGVDLAIHAIDHLVHKLGREDCQFVFVGRGEVFDDIVALTEQLGLSDYVTFPGWVPHDEVAKYIGHADVGLQPDPKNPRTDLATAVKTMEYMSFGIPVVAFDLDETRATVQDAALYATNNDPRQLGDAIDTLLNSAERRAAMGALGLLRVRDELSWNIQEQTYIAAFDRLLGGAAGRSK